MKVGDLCIYQNRKIMSPATLELNGSVVVIMEAWQPQHVKIMFLKTGYVAESCWIGHLEPMETE
jgi:hypothetical protein